MAGRIGRRLGRDGNPLRRRSDRIQARATAALVLLLLTAGPLLAGARAALVGLLDRRRLRQWQDQWLEVEPRWSGGQRF